MTNFQVQKSFYSLNKGKSDFEIENVSSIKERITIDARNDSSLVIGILFNTILRIILY